MLERRNVIFYLSISYSWAKGFTQYEIDGKITQKMDSRMFSIFLVLFLFQTGFADTFMESNEITGFSFMEKVNGAIYKYTHVSIFFMVK